MKDGTKLKRESYTPILDGYKTVYRHCPGHPEVARIIDRSCRTITINLSARLGAKIDMLTG